MKLPPIIINEGEHFLQNFDNSEEEAYKTCFCAIEFSRKLFHLHQEVVLMGVSGIVTSVQRTAAEKRMMSSREYFQYLKISRHYVWKKDFAAF